MSYPRPNCAAIKVRLDAAQALLEQMLSGKGIRAVQDSDGSRVEYSMGNAKGQQELVNRLRAEYDLCLRCHSGPFGFVF